VSIEWMHKGASRATIRFDFDPQIILRAQLCTEEVFGIYFENCFTITPYYTVGTVDVSVDTPVM
jgi:hypothetical protein